MKAGTRDRRRHGADVSTVTNGDSKDSKNPAEWNLSNEEILSRMVLNREAIAIRVQCRLVGKPCDGEIWRTRPAGNIDVTNWIQRYSLTKIITLSAEVRGIEERRSGGIKDRQESIPSLKTPAAIGELKCIRSRGQT